MPKYAEGAVSPSGKYIVKGGKWQPVAMVKSVSELTPEEAKARLHSVMTPGTGEGTQYIRPDAPLGQAAGHLGAATAVVLPFSMTPRALGTVYGAEEGYRHGGVKGAIGGAVVGAMRPGVALLGEPVAEASVDMFRGHPIRGAINLALAYLGGRSLRRLPRVAKEIQAAQEAEAAGKTLSAEKRALLETARARRAAQAERAVAKARRPITAAEGGRGRMLEGGGDQAIFSPGASRIPPPQPPPPPSAEYISQLKAAEAERSARLEKFWREKLAQEAQPAKAEILPKGQRAMATNLGGHAKPGPPPTPPDKLEEALRASLVPKGSGVIQMTRSATATAAGEGEHVSQTFLPKAREAFIKFVKEEGPKHPRGERVYFVSDAEGNPIKSFESGAKASGWLRRKENKGKGYFIDFFENHWGLSPFKNLHPGPPRGVPSYAPTDPVEAMKATLAALKGT